MIPTELGSDGQCNTRYSKNYNCAHRGGREEGRGGGNLFLFGVPPQYEAICIRLKSKIGHKKTKQCPNINPDLPHLEL